MATAQERLTAAEDAYHELMLGRSVVEVEDQNGERIKYTPANANRLATYIEKLKQEVAGTCAGPLKVWF